MSDPIFSLLRTNIHCDSQNLREESELQQRHQSLFLLAQQSESFSTSSNCSPDWYQSRETPVHTSVMIEIKINATDHFTSKRLNVSHAVK